VKEVSLANGICSELDECCENMEMLQTKWIEWRMMIKHVDEGVRKKETDEFHSALKELKMLVTKFTERSGIKTTGKRDAKNDAKDNRSALEIGLCEEVCEACLDFTRGIIERAFDDLKVDDNRLKSSLKGLNDFVDELHEKNVATLKHTLCVDKPLPTNKWKKREIIRKEVEDRLKQEKEEFVNDVSMEDTEEIAPPAHQARGPGGHGGRGGLMDAIAARGRGGQPGRSAQGGRGGLMDAIAARGRGGQPGRSAQGGRGGLMDAIAARGRGGQPGRSAQGGRGGLMDAIAARGAKN